MPGWEQWQTGPQARGAQGRYRIRSLYFDNLEDKALREKLDGVNHREKFRIRFYNGNTDVIHLEKKSKHGDLCAKQAAPISREACEALLAGDIRPLCRSGDPLLLELYAKMRYEGLRPRTLVDYLREAYVYSPGNVRVTLDWDVRSGVRCIDLFNLSAPTLRATEGGALLLEVKFDAFLPEVIKRLSSWTPGGPPHSPSTPHAGYMGNSRIEAPTGGAGRTGSIL